MIEIATGAGSGRIGPFWWINSTCSSFELVGLYGLTSNPSRHLAWREGACGISFPGRGAGIVVRAPRFHLIQGLSKD